MRHEIIKILLSEIGIKVRPGIAEQGDEYPFIIYRQTTRIPNPTKDGISKTDFVNYNILVSEKTYSEAEQYSNRIRLILDEISIENLKIRFIDETYRFDSEAQVHIFDSNFKITEKL